MKRILVGILSLIFVGAKSQVIFSDSYGNLTLQNDIQVFGSKTITTTYTTAPAGYSLINDGFKNNVGSINAPNQPFNVTALKTTGWAIGYNSIEADTFLVSTSWLDTTAAASRFIVTPVVSSITANSVLSWNAISPDINFPEGYEVYVTTNTTGTLTSADFTLANRIFYLADGNTPGQGEKSVWTKHGLSLAAYNGQDIRIAFKNISKNMFQLWIDDVVVENISNSVDAALGNSPLFYKYNTPNTNGAIFCSVTNRGSSNITALTLNYSVIGVSNETQAFSLATPMTPYATSDFTFSIPYNIATPGYYKLKMWVNSVNSGSDSNVNNDTINSYICIVTSAPAKNTLVEQFLSAYDGYSPDGQEKLKALTGSSVIAVNHHDGDSLSTSTVSSLIATYRKKTTTAMVDRTYFSDIASVPVERTSYASRINLRKAVVVPVSVSINKNYDSITRILNFTVSASFVGEVKGDYRMNAFITENNVYGPIMDTSYNGWNQLSFMYNIPFSPYFQQGYYLSAQDGYLLNAHQYKHQNVLDASLDGSFGVAGVIPSTGGTQGQTFTKAYSYTVPASPAGQFRYTPENMYIVAYVSEYSINKNFRSVLNCTQDKLTLKSESLVSVQELNSKAEFILYPNPSFGITNILIPENSFKKQVNISVIDILGKEVYNQNAGMSFGLIQLNLNHLNNGTYFMIVSDGNTRAAKKLVIVK
ncbi:MAG: T9SS type A sorting domain-containing protein [Bacteroidia bacterium]|nr:T9SS type A sorting domain-containing protein [Bacteroidia bacterium]